MKKALLIVVALGALVMGGCSGTTEENGVTIERRGLF